MKKSRIAICLISAAALFQFISCDLNGSSSSSDGLKKATDSVSAEYADKPLIVDAGSNVKSVTISNTSSASGKGVYLAKVNNDYTTAIAASKIRYVSSVSGITKTTSAALYDVSNDCNDTTYEDETLGTGCLTPYLENLNPEDFIRGESDAQTADGTVLLQSDESSQTTTDTFETAGAAVGATKTLHLLYEHSNGKNYVYSVQCEILAVSSDPKILIWAPVESSSYSLSSSETNFKSSSTQSSSTDTRLNGKTWYNYYLDCLKDIYQLDRSVFGEEAEVSGSETESYLNFVFFNMDKYFSSSIRGYFYQGDYSSTSKLWYSNQGKFLYINTNPAINTTVWQQNSSGSYSRLDTYELITATMAHEFMHMIQYNQKYLKQGISCTTAFGEMMGELAKDLIIDYLNPSRLESVWERFRTFNSYYTKIGTTGYDSNGIYYSTNYAFGAWLCRNFGGVTLARDFIQNAYNSDDAIVHAVNSFNNTNYTIDDLIKLYVAAITISNSDYDYPLNKAAASQSSIVCAGTSLSSGTDYYYPMLAFNIFDLETMLEYSKYHMTNSAGYMSGPYLYNAYTQLTNLGSLPTYHGVQLCKIGTIDSDTDSITIDFTESGAENLQMYVIIGNDRAAK